MTANQIIAQIISAFSYILFLSCYHGKNMKNVLSVKLSVDILMIFHYFLLGAYSGLALNVIAASREIIFMNNDKKALKSPVWKYAFIAVNIISAIITWNSFYSILTACAGIIATISFWQKNVKRARIYALIISCLTFSYNLCVGAYVAVIGEALGFVSVLLAILKSKKTV